MPISQLYLLERHTMRRLSRSSSCIVSLLLLWLLLLRVMLAILVLLLLGKGLLIVR